MNEAASGEGRAQEFEKALEGSDMLSELGPMTIQKIGQAVETLSGGQRQGVAVARAAAFSSRAVIMDEPTAALGAKDSRCVLELILDVKKRGMPHVFEVADRIHIHRLGRRFTAIDPRYAPCRMRWPS